MNVVIIDDRKPWMIKEDKYMKCFMECHLFWVCQSRMGVDCKRLGGTEIPKIRN